MDGLSGIGGRTPTSSRLRQTIVTFHGHELASMGLSRGELRAIAAMTDDQVARMERMARLHGLDPADLDRLPRARLDAARNCTRCPVKATCALVLGRAGPLATADGGFCPGAGLFRELARALPH